MTDASVIFRQCNDEERSKQLLGVLPPLKGFIFPTDIFLSA
jgi:hypothetical protein